MSRYSRALRDYDCGSPEWNAAFDARSDRRDEARDDLRHEPARDADAVATAREALALRLSPVLDAEDIAFPEAGTVRS